MEESIEKHNVNEASGGTSNQISLTALVVNVH